MRVHVLFFMVLFPAILLAHWSINPAINNTRYIDGGEGYVTDVIVGAGDENVGFRHRWQGDQGVNNMLITHIASWAILRVIHYFSFEKHLNVVIIPWH